MSQRSLGVNFPFWRNLASPSQPFLLRSHFPFYRYPHPHPHPPTSAHPHSTTQRSAPTRYTQSSKTAHPHGPVRALPSFGHPSVRGLIHTCPHPARWHYQPLPQLRQTRESRCVCAFPLDLPLAFAHHPFSPIGEGGFCRVCLRGCSQGVCSHKKKRHRRCCVYYYYCGRSLLCGQARTAWCTRRATSARTRSWR